jgi:hypothetical protein
MVKEITHGFRAGGHVWGEAFGKASKFVCGAVQPIVSVGSSNQLGMFVGFARECVNGSVC